MVLTKTPVNVNFGQANQKKGRELQLPGALLAAENVQQLETGVYSKRYGYSAMDRTASSGSITSAFQLFAGNAGLHLQANDSLFVRQAGQSRWINRGSNPIVCPRARIVLNRGGTKPGAFIDSVSGNTAVWAGGNGALYLRIFETATEVDVLPESTVASSGAAYYFAKGVVANGFLFLFYMAHDNGAGTTLGCLKYNMATGAFVTSATAMGVVIPSGFDVMSLGGQVYVLAVDGSVTVRTIRLNQTTLVADGLGTTTFALGAGSNSTATWAQDHNGADGFLWYIVSSSTTSYTNKVALTTLAHTGVSSSPGSPLTVFQAFMGGAATPSGSGFANAAIGANRFELRHDTSLVQESTSLVASGAVGARALYGRGGDADQRGGLFFTAAISAPLQARLTAFLTQPQVVGAKIYTTVSTQEDSSSGPNAYQTSLICWDTAPSISAPVSLNNGRCILLPGGFGRHVTDGAAILKTPQKFPYLGAATTKTTAGASIVFPNGTYSWKAVYLYRGADGTIHYGPPSAASNQTLTNPGAAPFPSALQVASASLDDGFLGITPTPQVQYFATATNGATYFLQSTSDMSAVPGGTEELYTTGRALEAAPLPPWRIGFSWNNHVFLTGTDRDGVIWPSLEMLTSGVGPIFNEDVSLYCPGGSGPFMAGGPISETHAAFLKQDAIFVISGSGPSDTGVGNYEPQRLNTEQGTTNPNVATCPLGLVYQGKDGGIWLIDAATLQARYIGDGVDDHKSATITGAIHLPKKQHVRLFTSTGKCLVLDYGHKGPAGEQTIQWYVWNLPATAVSACVYNDTAQYVDATGVVWREVEGQYFDNVSTQIRMKVQPSRLVLAGIAGYKMCYRALFVNEFVGNHTLSITINGETKTKALTAGPEEIEFRPSNPMTRYLDITIEEAATADLTAGFTFTGFGLEIGVVPGLSRVSTTQRI